MFEDGFHFYFPGVGDIYCGVGLIRKRAPYFFWHMRLMTFCEQSWKICNVICGREDSVKDDLSAGAVVGMVEAIERKQGLWITCHENIRFVPADLADNVSAQIQVWDEVPILKVQKMNRASTDDFRGVILFHVS